MSEHVRWGVDNPGPGSFIGDGRYETSQAAAGHVTVRAFAGQVEGTAKLDVIATLTIVDDVFPPPVGAETLFAAGTPAVAADPSRSPVQPRVGAGTPRHSVSCQLRHVISENCPVTFGGIACLYRTRGGRGAPNFIYYGSPAATAATTCTDGRIVCGSC